MKKLISLILLLCCFAALGLCLWLRANLEPEPAAAPAPAQTAEPAAPAESAPAEPAAAPEPEPAATPEPEPAEPAGPGGEAEIIPETGAADPMTAYEPVLASYRMWIAGGRPELSNTTERGDYYLELGETGVSILCNYGGTLGYMLTDMDGNGVPELLIGSDGGEYPGSYIYDMFTLENGAPKRVLSSSERVAYMLYPENRVLHRGSGGAAYNFMAVYRYAGGTLTLTDGVVMAGEDQFYEVTSEGDSIFFERQPDDRPISREEYYARADAMEAETVPLTLQPIQ